MFFRSPAAIRAAVFLLLSSSFLRLHAATDTVAVLPFSNGTNDRTLDWVGESVADTVHEALSTAGVIALPRDERLEVLRRLSVRSGVPLTHATIYKIGEAMDAAQVIYGSFELSPAAAGSKSRGELKLTASVINVKRMSEGPRFAESGPLEDLSLLQSRLAWQAMHYLQPKTAPPENSFLRDRPPVRVEAVESYIRGLLSGSPETEWKFFQQSLKIDPRFSEPAFQLGRMAFEKKDYATSRGWLEKVSPADSHYNRARFFLGLCAFYQGDYDEAAKVFQAVAERVPLDEVYNDLGAAESRRGQTDAVTNFKKALEGDASDPDYWFNLGYAQWKTGQLADAVKSFRAVLDRTPDDPKAKEMLARCQRGDLPHAGETLKDERMKTTFEESLFQQLKAELKSDHD